MNFARVAEKIAATGCRCNLHPGMSYAELMAMDGCRSGWRYQGGYVCEALDLYRRLARSEQRLAA